jgi:2-polyprenyl-6-methoxyphenol hydroxylase-like FAD-dependent oxidoreductase
MVAIRQLLGGLEISDRLYDARAARRLIRQGTTRVTGIRGHGKGGGAVTERATVVVGADGRHSRVAESVRATQYNEQPPLLAAYYSYWSGVAIDGRFETYIRPRRGMAAAPTHDGLTLVIAGWPHAEFDANKKDLEGHFLKVLELAPELGGACALRDARNAACGHAGCKFLPRPIRSRVGARGRRGLQQGSDLGAGHQ